MHRAVWGSVCHNPVRAVTGATHLATALFTDNETGAFKSTTEKFRRLFNAPAEEKLVNHYSCR